MRCSSKAVEVLFVVSFILLPPLLGGDAPEGQNVLVGRPLVRLMSTDTVANSCRTRVPACTKFVGFRLDIACRADDRGATMLVTAHFTPWVILSEMRWLDHELAHIGDLRESLEHYVRRLEASRFDRLSDCERASLSERMDYPKVLRGFAQVSTARLDGPPAVNPSAPPAFGGASPLRRGLARFPRPFAPTNRRPGSEP